MSSTKDKLLKKSPQEQQNTAGASTTGTTAPPTTYQEWYESMNPNAVQTPEQIAQAQKKQKRDMFFAKLGDGIRVFSNLIATTKGAPNARLDGAMGQNAVKNSYSQLQQDYEARKRAYMAGRMQAMAMDLEELHRKNAEDRAARLDARDENRYQEGIEFRNKQAKQQQDNWQKTYDASQAQQAKDNKFREDELKFRKNTSAADRQQRNKFHEDSMNQQPKQLPASSGADTTYYTGRNGKFYPVIDGTLTEGNVNNFYNAVPAEYRERFEIDPTKKMSAADKWAVVQQYIADPMYSSSNEQLANDIWRIVSNKHEGVATAPGTAVAPQDFTL